LREVELGEDEQPKKANEAPPGQGCQLDLVRLGLDGRDARWWSFGFEGFGTFEAVERNLARTIEHLARTAPPALAGGLELSYPAWLDRVVSHG
jgi:hypothetical protein